MSQVQITRMKHARMAAKIPIEVMATHLGVPLTAYRKWENGEGTPPKAQKLAIASYLHKNPRNILKSVAVDKATLLKQEAEELEQEGGSAPDTATEPTEVVDPRNMYPTNSYPDDVDNINRLKALTDPDMSFDAIRKVASSIPDTLVQSPSQSQYESPSKSTPTVEISGIEHQRLLAGVPRSSIKKRLDLTEYVIRQFESLTPPREVMENQILPAIPMLEEEFNTTREVLLRPVTLTQNKYTRLKKRVFSDAIRAARYERLNKQKVELKKQETIMTPQEPKIEDAASLREVSDKIDEMSGSEVREFAKRIYTQNLEYKAAADDHKKSLRTVQERLAEAEKKLAKFENVSKNDAEIVKAVRQLVTLVTE